MTADETWLQNFSDQILLERQGPRESYRAVYRNQQVTRPVTLHLFRFRHAADWKDLELAYRQVETLRQVKHPSLPEVVWVSRLGESDFAYATAARNAQPMDTFLARAAIRQDDVGRILVQALQALYYLHQLSPPVIHRNISPETLCVDAHGALFIEGFEALQVGYQGIEGGSTVVAHNGCAPPEQLMGRAEPASDIYALGVSCVALLMGVKPQNLALKGAKLVFRDTLAHVSPALLDVLEKMVEPQLSQRYTSVEEVLRDLGEMPDLAHKAVHYSPKEQALLAERETALNQAIRALDGPIRCTRTSEGIYVAGDAFYAPPFQQILSTAERVGQVLLGLYVVLCFGWMLGYPLVTPEVLLTPDARPSLLVSGALYGVAALLFVGVCCWLLRLFLPRRWQNFILFDGFGELSNGWSNKVASRSKRLRFEPAQIDQITLNTATRRGAAAWEFRFEDPDGAPVVELTFFKSQLRQGAKADLLQVFEAYLAWHKTRRDIARAHAQDDAERNSNKQEEPAGIGPREERDARELEPGTTPGGPIHGRYEVLKALSSGSQGHVFLARDMREGREVILKELRLDTVQSWAAIELFEREARALKKLRGRTVPAYIDHFVTPDKNGTSERYILVESYIKGKSLQEMINEKVLLSTELFEQIFRQALMELEAIHRAGSGVIHRDIKPSNLMWGEDQRLYFIDFNGALFEGESSDLFVGTAGFVAPEQVHGHPSAASDVYALGRTFIALSTQLDLGRDEDLSPAFLRGAMKHLPDRLVQTLLTMTHEDVDKRFQSAGEALEFKVGTIPVRPLLERLHSFFGALKHWSRERSRGPRLKRLLASTSPASSLSDGLLSKFAQDNEALSRRELLRVNPPSVAYNDKTDIEKYDAIRAYKSTDNTFYLKLEAASGIRAIKPHRIRALLPENIKETTHFSGMILFFSTVALFLGLLAPLKLISLYWGILPWLHQKDLLWWIDNAAVSLLGISLIISGCIFVLQARYKFTPWGWYKRSVFEISKGHVSWYSQNLLGLKLWRGRLDLRGCAPGVELWQADTYATPAQYYLRLHRTDGPEQQSPQHLCALPSTLSAEEAALVFQLVKDALEKSGAHRPQTLAELARASSCEPTINQESRSHLASSECAQRSVSARSEQ